MGALIQRDYCRKHVSSKNKIHAFDIMFAYESGGIDFEYSQIERFQV